MWSFFCSFLAVIWLKLVIVIVRARCYFVSLIESGWKYFDLCPCTVTLDVSLSTGITYASSLLSPGPAWPARTPVEVSSRAKVWFLCMSFLFLKSAFIFLLLVQGSCRSGTAYITITDCFFVFSIYIIRTFMSGKFETMQVSSVNLSCFCCNVAIARSWLSCLWCAGRDCLDRAGQIRAWSEAGARAPLWSFISLWCAFCLGCGVLVFPSGFQLDSLSQTRWGARSSSPPPLTSRSI